MTTDLSTKSPILLLTKSKIQFMKSHIFYKFIRHQKIFHKYEKYFLRLIFLDQVVLVNVTMRHAQNIIPVFHRNVRINEVCHLDSTNCGNKQFIMKDTYKISISRRNCVCCVIGSTPNESKQRKRDQRGFFCFRSSLCVMKFMVS